MANNTMSQRKSYVPEESQEPVLPTLTFVPLNALEKADHNPKGWPTSPNRVHTSVYTLITNILVDIILLTCSVAFLAFAIMGPTVFPILYAAVIGRAAHSILRWRLERGERIGVLDLLASCSSLTSTITSQFQLRMISFLGLSLVVLWALSPVGGQASFRQISIGQENFNQVANYTYMSPSNYLTSYGDSDRQAFWAIVYTLFNAAMIGPAEIKSSARDLWGNVKMPSLQHYENVAIPDKDGWFSIDVEDGLPASDYVSLVGIPISNIISSSINYRMNIENMYFNLNCTILPGVQPYAVDAKHSLNVTNPTTEDVIYWYNATNRMNVDPADLAPWNFTYNSDGPQLQCLVTASYIEAQVACPTSSTCAVTKIRPSQQNHPPAAFTPLDMRNLYAPGYSNWGLFALGLISSQNGRPSYPTLMDNYLIEPDDPAFLAGTKTSTPTNETYSLRFSQLFNSFWICANAPYALSGGLSANTSFYIPNVSYLTNFTGYNDGKTMLWQTTGSMGTEAIVIQAHKGWVIALSIASTILILASLVSPFVRCFLTRGPDVIMNISSLATRNNPFIPLPETGSYLSASDRARLLKHIKVRFGDVESTANVGLLTLSSLDGVEGVRIDPIIKERVYQ